MSIIGATVPCDVWLIPNNTFLQVMTIGYNISGVTYLSALTSTNILFQRGNLLPTDNSVVY